MLKDEPTLAAKGIEITSKVASAGGQAAVKGLEIPAIQAKVDDVAIRLMTISVNDEADPKDDSKGRLC